MPLGERSLHERRGEKGAPPKRRDFTAIGSTSVKMIADRHRHPAYHNKHRRRAFLKMWTLMTLNDREPPK